MTGSRLYVARDPAATVVSRQRLRLNGARVVERPWSMLVEATVPNLRKADKSDEPRDVTWFVLPPVVAGGIVAALGPVEVGVLVAAGAFFGAAYIEPAIRRRRRKKRTRDAPSDARILIAPVERAAFDQAIELADSVSTTWPRLGELISTAEAEAMLTDALWEISGVLARHQKLTLVLADLSRPDFAAQSPTDETAMELRSHRQATEQALAELEADLTRRESSLRRAAQAGQEFIREDEMRRAIRAAQETLEPPSSTTNAITSADAAADLADRTRSVLDAYRELTADIRPDPPM